MQDRVIILLVEDEPLILLAVQTLLEDAGYACLTAADGAEGLRLIDEHVGDAQGLVTDVRLPHTDGWHLARHARQHRPDLPVIYTTGDSAADWSAEGVPNSIVLQKPYAEAQLVTAISQLLNAAGPIRPAA